MAQKPGVKSFLDRELLNQVGPSQQPSCRGLAHAAGRVPPRS